MFLLLALAGWLSSQLVAVDQTPDRLPGPGASPAVQYAPPTLAWKPGTYTAEQLTAPKVVAMETYDYPFPTGPNWPVAAAPAIVVIDQKDPDRFLAFLIDLATSKVVAIRDGNRDRHLRDIGKLTRPGTLPDVRNGEGRDVGTIGRVDRGTGAVIVVPPPRPVGPGGIPTDIMAAILDVGHLVGQAQRSMQLQAQAGSR